MTSHKEGPSLHCQAAALLTHPLQPPTLIPHIQGFQSSVGKCVMKSTHLPHQEQAPAFTEAVHHPCCSSHPAAGNDPVPQKRGLCFTNFLGLFQTATSVPGIKKGLVSGRTLDASLCILVHPVSSWALSVLSGAQGW
jgi:hypothetical protein